MGRVSVDPEEFTLVPYDAAVIAEMVEEVAVAVGFPDGVHIHLDVDEELFSPLTGHTSDAVGGDAHLWVSGANFEDTRHPRHFDPVRARRDLAVMLLRAADRLDDELGDDLGEAPPDTELTRAERAAWDVFATARAARLGFDVREQVARYDYRLQLGFSDEADALFDRLWAAERCTWAELRAACERVAAPRPDGRVPVDALRRR